VPAARTVPTAGTGDADALLQVRGLNVEFRVDGRWTPVVRDVSFDVVAGRTLGLVGESGSGKTVSAMALLGLTAATGGRITAGSVRLDGRELVGLDPEQLREVRGRQLGMIFQQPMRSLNPAFTVGEQIAETVRRHLRLPRRQAWARAVEMLDLVRIPEPARRAHDYPHMLSGGMCQRVMIAMAVACEPRIVVADEPTTALDVTVQKHVLQLLRDLQEQTGIGLVFVSHDLAVIAEMCDSVAVMYAGEIVEHGDVEPVFFTPTHPYTAALLASIPRAARGQQLRATAGSVPAPGAWPAGCHFEPRCAHAVPDRCDAATPELVEAAGHRARCVRVGELQLAGVTRA
jgi:oligopeptide/dipeptide ABC transporter ATP-binding protein